MTTIHYYLKQRKNPLSETRHSFGLYCRVVRGKGRRTRHVSRGSGRTWGVHPLGLEVFPYLVTYGGKGLNMKPRVLSVPRVETGVLRCLNLQPNLI